MIRSSRVFLVPLVLVLALASCSSGDGSGSTTTSVAATTTIATTVPPVSTTVDSVTTTSQPGQTTTTTTLNPTTTTVPPTTTEDPGPGVTIVAIEVANGEVVEGEEIVEIARDAEVEIIISADISDEVHLHGYNIFANVTPETPASITFVANIPGIFEVELEGFGLLLVELEIS